MESIELLTRVSGCKWVAPSFVILKKKKTIRFLNDFGGPEYQTVFWEMKNDIAQDKLLMYSAYGEHFVIYTDESKYQIGAVISQNEEFVVYFSRKFNHA